MLGIEIGNEFLDLPPGTVMELEKENPFLQFQDQLLGEYSLPFSVLATAKNLRLLNYAAVMQQHIANTGIDANIYDKSIQIGSGKIKIEKSSINLNRTSKGLINCYYLSGTSGFWQDIKDKKLRDIDVGGNRSFAWEGLSTITDGFWKHIHQVAAGAVAAYDYAFYPVINKDWPTEDTNPEIMNMMYYDAMEAFPVRFPSNYVPINTMHEANRIVPFPYLKYVLQKAFDYVGWTVSGDILDDPDFIKVTMLSFRAIDWCFVVRSGGSWTQTYRNPVVFDLKDSLPDITIAKFLIALKNRFGWWYDIDNTAKKITIRNLSALTDAQPQDMTGNSSPLITKSIVQDKPVYALRNNFATGIGDGAPNFKVINFVGNVDAVTDLPTAAEALYGNVYLVEEENNYYICQQNEADTWEWMLYAANIYDYEPEGFTDDITTDATLVGNEWWSSYLDFIPRIDNIGEWNGRSIDPSTWGIHLLFYFGQRDNRSGDPVPFASHHVYDANGYALAAWSLAFKGNKTDATEIGLYDLNWKAFLDMISGAEEIEFTLRLPLHKYLQLKFSDRINIAGVLLFIKKVRASLPYKGQVQCVAVRV
jgi:hypothetical protein